MKLNSTLHVQVQHIQTMGDTYVHVKSLHVQVHVLAQSNSSLHVQVQVHVLVQSNSTLHVHEIHVLYMEYMYM